MTFEEWYATYPDETDYDTGMKDAFNAGTKAGRELAELVRDITHPSWHKPDSFEDCVNRVCDKARAILDGSK